MALARGSSPHQVWYRSPERGLLDGKLMRFRWIEPGEFLMGSPEGEKGRDDGEGPRHVVRLTEGYWLAETQGPLETMEISNCAVFNSLSLTFVCSL